MFVVRMLWYIVDVKLVSGIDDSRSLTYTIGTSWVPTKVGSIARYNTVFVLSRQCVICKDQQATISVLVPT